MNEGIAKVISEIIEVSTLINLETEHDVFVSMRGHVNKIEVEFYKYGWDISRKRTMRCEVYFDDKDKVKKLNKVLSFLMKIYKMSKINVL